MPARRPVDTPPSPPLLWTTRPLLSSPPGKFGRFMIVVSPGSHLTQNDHDHEEELYGCSRSTAWRRRYSSMSISPRAYRSARNVSAGPVAAGEGRRWRIKETAATSRLPQN